MLKNRKHPLIVTLLPLLLLAWLLAPLSAAAQATAVPGQSSAVHDVFWSIEKDDGPAGYLLGTVHSEDPRVLEFTAPFLGRLGACDQFAMELVPDLGTMQRLLAYMQLDGEQELEALTGPERYARLVAAMDGYRVPTEQLRRMKPWAAMMSLSLPPPKTGLFLDFQLSLRASGSGATVSGLETLEEQLSFLENLPLPQQLELLDQALEDFDRVQVIHDALVDSYLFGTLASLQAEADEQMASLTPATRRYFVEEGIDARNARMVQAALPLLDTACTFIAVGALHLPGPAGMIALLEREGYTLRALPTPFAIVAKGASAGEAR